MAETTVSRTERSRTQARTHQEKPHQPNGEIKPRGHEKQPSKPKSFIERMQDRFSPRSPQDNPLIHPTVPWEVGRRAAEARQQPQITFNDALEQAKVINALRDEKEIILSAGDLERFKKILRESGYLSDKEISKMTQQEIVATSQFALQKIKIRKPEDSDFKYPKGSGERKAREALATQEVEKLQSPDEEILTPEKISKLIHVEEYVSVVKGAGVGAMEAEDWTSELPGQAETGSEQLNRYIRGARKIGDATITIDAQYDQLKDLESSLKSAILSGELDDRDEFVMRTEEALSRRIRDLSRAIRFAERGGEIGGLEPSIEAPSRETVDRLMDMVKAGTTTGEEWGSERTKVEGIIENVERLAESEEPSGYRRAYYADKAIKDSLRAYRDVVDNLPDDVRSRLESFVNKKEGALAHLDQKFQQIFREMDTDDRQIIADIDRDASAFYKQVSSGFGATPEQAKRALENMIGNDPTGLREWRVMKAIVGLDNAIRINQLTEPPVIWQETPEKIANIYAFIEGTDFAVDELGVAIQQAINMVRQIQPDTPAGREMRAELVKELDAFRAFHSLRITLERNDMDPSEFLPLFRQYFDDDTWIHFVNRFGRDERYRGFFIPKKDSKGRYRDVEGKETTDIEKAASHEAVNLLDVSFELYSEQLRQDRIRMDMVEEMTKHAIDSDKFKGDTLRQIQMGVGLRDENGRISKLFPLKEKEFNEELESLRLRFVEKIGEEIKKGKQAQDLKGLSIDEVWGRKRTIKVNGREIDLLGVTADVIRDWHTKKTLQGAFGFCRQGDLAELAKEFGISKEEAGKRYLGKSFLDIRRGQVLDGLESRLAGMKLNMGDSDKPDFRVADLDKLRESGFLESVDSNAYHFAWVTQWSVYDSIRIYSRDTKSKLRDDYDHLVYNQSSNLYFGRQIDQTWEFLHERNENRGRPKENDVNRIWKQFLPGKHSWLFPQNNIATRWAGFFMTDAQEKEVAQRTENYMVDHDFDNQKHHDDFKGWMQNVVVRDMIESGEISFGSGSKKLSEAANEVKLRKFEFVDVFVDRGKHLKFTNPEVLQDYLVNPTEGKFININDKVKGYYSTRDARQFPWMTLALRAHWEVASKHSLRLFDKPDLTAADGENLTNGLVRRGDMEKSQGNKEKRKLFGFQEIGGQIKIGGLTLFPDKEFKVKLPEFFGSVPFRRARQKMEELRRAGYDSKTLLFLAFLAGLWAGIVEFAKQMPRQLATQSR